MRQGYFWPTLNKDSAKMVKKCEECQFFANLTHAPPTRMTPLHSPIPFSQWKIDLVTDLPATVGNKKWLIVAIDYFTKCVEAEALVFTTQDQIIKFVWRNIICRFGLPRVIVTDNGTQFIGGKVEEFFAKHRIQHRITSVSHPQTNGLTEVTNRTLVHSLKTLLFRTQGQWMDELLSVL